MGHCKVRNLGWGGERRGLSGGSHVPQIPFFGLHCHLALPGPVPAIQLAIRGPIQGRNFSYITLLLRQAVYPTTA